MSEPQTPARAEATREGDALVVRVGGNWQIVARWPEWRAVVGDDRPKELRFETDDLESWDSSLALFLNEGRAWSESVGATLNWGGLPPAATELAGFLVARAPQTVGPHPGLPGLFTFVGAATVALWRETKDLARLVGECAFSIGRFFRGQAQFRWRDCLHEMQECGVMSLPIVGLISFLVGVTLAYMGSLIVRQYGGDVWIADMVGVAMTREMGPLMMAIVLAGRTGAAFAATLGNMKANEEIDALETLGVSPIDFLVMPRIVAVCAMMPFLALYADTMGILGGMLIAALPPLNIPPNLYYAEMQTIVDLSDINTGLIKAATFGLLIGLSGCLRGMQAERSSAGVGQAATRAVVTSILLIVVADSIYAVVFDILGW